MGSRILLTICALCFGSIMTYLAISLGFIEIVQIQYLGLSEQVLFVAGFSLPLFFWFSTFLRRPY